MDKKTWVGRFPAGLALEYRGWRLDLSVVWATVELVLQDELDAFGLLAQSIEH